VNDDVCKSNFLNKDVESLCRSLRLVNKFVLSEIKGKHETIEMYNKRVKKRKESFIEPGCSILCRFVKGGSDEELKVPVSVVRVFGGSLCLVRFESDEYQYGNNGYWVVRHGFEMGELLVKIIRMQKYNQSVPIDFNPIRKIPSEIRNQMELASPSKLILIIEKLREVGFLPSLYKLTQKGLPEGLKLESIRKYYQSF